MPTASTADAPHNAFGLPDDWERGEVVQVQCVQCEKTFHHNTHLARLFTNTVCDQCSDEYDRRERDEVVKETLQRREIAELNIPPLYRETVTAKLPYPEQADSVMAWHYTEGAKGLWITGDTRAGKTRTVCLLIARLVRDGVDVQTFFHGSFADELLEVLRSDRNYRRWKFKIACKPVLVVDDLFAGKLTERSEAALFEVLDERIAHHRPTLITTQVTKTEADKLFHSMARCEAFFARIKEFFTVVRLGEKQLNFAGGKGAAFTKR